MRQAQQNQNDGVFANNESYANALKILSVVFSGIAVMRFSNDEFAGGYAELCYAVAALLFAQTLNARQSDSIKKLCLRGAIGFFIIGRVIDSEDFIPLNYSASELR